VGWLCSLPCALARCALAFALPPRIGCFGKNQELAPCCWRLLPALACLEAIASEGRWALEVRRLEARSKAKSEKGKGKREKAKSKKQKAKSKKRTRKVGKKR
jgi:hypothetical protein